MHVYVSICVCSGIFARGCKVLTNDMSLSHMNTYVKAVGGHISGARHTPDSTFLATLRDTMNYMQRTGVTLVVFHWYILLFLSIYIYISLLYVYISPFYISLSLP
jgi:hypothetical protein